jgi:hypothetical protein
MRSACAGTIVLVPKGRFGVIHREKQQDCCTAIRNADTPASLPPDANSLFHDESEKLTPEERSAREARDAERRRDAEQALREHQLAQDAFYQNLERLRAWRLAREALAKK